jgi:hypothetical protein
MTPYDLAEIIQICYFRLQGSSVRKRKAVCTVYLLISAKCFYGTKETESHSRRYYSTPSRLLGVWCQKYQTDENENYVLQANLSIWIPYFIEICVTVCEIKHEDERRDTTFLFHLYTRIVFNLGHDHLLPNSLQSTIHLWPHNSHIVCDIESFAKTHQTIAHSCYIVSHSVIFFLLGVSLFSFEDFLTVGRFLKEIGRNQLFIQYNISVAA